MNNTELVTLTDNTITTTSLIVAETYGKQHKHVLTDIKNLIKTIDDLESQDGSIPTRPRFRLSEYKDESGKANKMYLLDRNAWTLLVMGYTGPNATRFKLRYIAAFDTMEEQLKDNAELMMTIALGTIEQIGSQKRQLESNIEQKVILTEAAEQIGLPVKTMTKALRDRKYFYEFQYNNNEPVDNLKDRHLFIVWEGVKTGKMKYPARQTYVTPAGIEWLRDEFEDIVPETDLIEPTMYHDF